MGKGRFSAPRSLGGGRSDRYEERREYHGSSKRYAPAWTDAAAESTLLAMERSARLNSSTVGVQALQDMVDRQRMEALVADAQRGLNLADRALVDEVFG